MPRKEEIEIYTFAELSPEAKERAIREYRDRGWAWDEADSKMLSEFFAEELEALGLPTEDIRWRLDYSSGDGVAFYGKVDLADYIQKNSLTKFEPIITAIENDEARIEIAIEKRQAFHMYDHWNTMVVTAEVDTYGEPRVGGRKRWPIRLGPVAIERMARELMAHLQDQVKDVSKRLEKSGYENIDYRESDQDITENIIANEYEFDEDGSFL